MLGFAPIGSLKPIFVLFFLIRSKSYRTKILTLYHWLCVLRLAMESHPAQLRPHSYLTYIQIQLQDALVAFRDWLHNSRVTVVNIFRWIKDLLFSPS